MPFATPLLCLEEALLQRDKDVSGGSQASPHGLPSKSRYLLRFCLLLSLFLTFNVLSLC